jgi:hypothetical protein
MENMHSLGQVTGKIHFSISLLFRYNLSLLRYYYYYFHVMDYSNLLTCSTHDPRYCRLTEQWKTERSGGPKFVHARKSQGASATALARLAASTRRSQPLRHAPAAPPVHGSVFNRAAVSDVRAVLHAAKSMEALRVKQGTHPPLFSFHIN